MGRANQVGLGLQPAGAQKVAATGPAVFLPLTSAGLDPTIATLEHQAMEGDRFPSRQKRGGRSYAGTTEGAIRPNSTGILFSMAWGTPVTTELEAGLVYQHVWNPKAAGKRPMPATAWLIQNDIYEETGNTADKVVDEYVGVMLNELSFTLEGNDYFLFSGGNIAIRNIEDPTAPVSTLDDTVQWSYDEVGAEISIPSVSAGAYAPFAIYNFGMTYGNDLQGADRFQIGSKEIVKLRPGNVEATTEFAAAENLEPHYRRAIADFPELVKLRLTATGKQIFEGTTDQFEKMIIDLKAIEYTSGGRPMTATDIWEDVEVGGRIIKDSSGGFFTVTIVNEHDGSDYAPVP